VPQERLAEAVSTLLRLKLHSYQLSFVDDCLHKGKIIACFPRQSGKSTAVAAFCLLAAVEKPQNILIVSPTQRQSDELLGKVSSMISGSAVLRKVIQRERNGEVLLRNGSRILSLPVGDDGRTILGFTAHVLVMEEASLIPDVIVNQVLMPMTATTKSTVVKIGTPRGRDGHFYRSYRDSSWAVHHITWREVEACGQYRPGFIEERLQDCVSLTFKTEYGGEFVEDASSFFGDALIDSSVDKQLELPRLIKESDEIIYCGVDVARLGKDETAIVVLALRRDGSAREVRYWEALRSHTLDRVAERINQLHSIFNFEKVFIDETGIGAGVVDFLAREHNPSGVVSGALTSVTLSRRNVSRARVIGVTFTAERKADLASYAKLVLEQGKLQLPAFQPLIQQLKDFRYEYSSSGRLLLHHPADALILAVQGIKDVERYTPLYTSLKHIPSKFPQGRTVSEIIRTYKRTGVIKY
jgi:hypothetical protein